MAGRFMPSISTLLILILAASAPAVAQSVSVGAGGLVPYLGPERPYLDLVGSIQVPVGRSLVIEGETTRSTGHTEFEGISDTRIDRPYFPFSTSRTDHEQLIVGANLLMRKPLGRMSGFVGGGMGGYRKTFRFQAHTTCRPRVPGGCDGRPDTDNHWEQRQSGPSWQLVGGFDVPLAARLSAFGAARWITAGDSGIGAFGGLRVPIAPAPAAAQVAPPSGPKVRVVGLDGSRHDGRLVTLGQSEVSLVEDEEVLTIPLRDVRSVRKVTHRVRDGVIWGAIAGFVAGYFASCGGGDEEDCWPEFGAMIAGPGAAAGAFLGATMNVTHQRSDLLYPAPNSPTATISPIVTPRRAGAALSVRW